MALLNLGYWKWEDKGVQLRLMEVLLVINSYLVINQKHFRQFWSNNGAKWKARESQASLQFILNFNLVDLNRTMHINERT